MTDNAWTDERLAQLRKLWDDGLSISQIGDALGVSRNAIAGKAHRMGL
ncbi:MAG: GcrA family cell cycle regulator, partial [Candidatus Puniceispirillaceae bacterium]